MPAVLGAIGAFAVWVLCLGTHEGARIVGLCWILAGLLMYAAVRIAAGLPLMSRVVVGEAPADELIGIPHRAIVVPLRSWTRWPRRWPRPHAAWRPRATRGWSG